MVRHAAGPVTAQPAVHIIDDDTSLRAALDRLLRSVGHVTRQFGSAQEFLDAGLSNAAGCLILDVRLPGQSGLDFQAYLRKIGALMPVILMTGYGDIPMTVRGMKAGAVDFLPKPFRDQDMLDAVAAALEKDAQRRIDEDGRRVLRERYATLTAREKEVMALVVTGLMNKQVGDRLHLSEITVKIHRGNVMKKMEAKSLAELVRFADAVKALPETEG